MTRRAGGVASVPSWRLLPVGDVLQTLRLFLVVLFAVPM